MGSIFRSVAKATVLEKQLLISGPLSEIAAFRWKEYD